MSKAYSIRRLRMEGDSIAEISRKLEVSRDTVYKYLAMDDLSQKPPSPRGRVSALDRYPPAHRELAGRGRAQLAQAAPHRAPHLGPPARRGRGRSRRVDRSQLREEAQARARHPARAVPRPGLGAGRRAGRFRRGRLLRRRRAHAHELLRHDVPLLERRRRPGLPRGERRVRLPGAAQHLPIIRNTPFIKIFENACSYACRSLSMVE